MVDFDFLSDSKNEIDDDYYEEEESASAPVLQNADELIGSINKDELTFDSYMFTIYDIKRDINKNEENRTEHSLRVLVFPFDIIHEEYNLKSAVAAYVEEGADFNCSAALRNGKKTFMVKSKNYDFIINGRWMRDKFISVANNMIDIAENREVKCIKDEYRAEEKHCMHLHYKHYEMYIMPIHMENINGYAPFIIALKKDGDENYIVAATESLFVYKELRLACIWTGDTLSCYAIKEFGGK